MIFNIAKGVAASSKPITSAQSVDVLAGRNGFILEVLKDAAGSKVCLDPSGSDNENERSLPISQPLWSICSAFLKAPPPPGHPQHPPISFLGVFLFLPALSFSYRETEPCRGP